MMLEIRAEAGLLRATATGEFSMEEAKRTFLEVLDAVAHHRAEKILLDGRELKGEPKTIERFLYGSFAAHAVATHLKRGAPRAPQFAYVLQEPVFDPQRFGETVAVNRGMWVKSFDNLGDALEWLGWAPANKAHAGDA
ncbi:MAG: hypothetical protein U5J82_07610 [Desulfobacterales bacterium]|nr:hypothetical protein [Desulfobacterales bacterium]